MFHETAARKYDQFFMKSSVTEIILETGNAVNFGPYSLVIAMKLIYSYPSSLMNEADVQTEQSSGYLEDVFLHK